MNRQVLTIGTFDIPHLGHAYLLRECERYGAVTVGINSDEFVERYKGQSPLFSFQERAHLIGLLGYETVKNESAGRECIEAVRPDVLVIGSDWARGDYYTQIDVTQDFLDDHGITMVYVPRVPCISSTEVRRRSA